MAAKAKVSFGSTGRGAQGEETSTNRRRLQDVLGQARAALRNSQQFRHIPADNSKNNNLSNKLQFTQQPQEDYWSSPTAAAAGGQSSNTAATEKNKLSKPSVENVNDESKSRANYRQMHRQQQSQDDDFGKPFRDALKKSPTSSLPKSGRIRKRRGVFGEASLEQLSSDASSSTSFSMNTNELRVSSGSDSEDYSSSDDSQRGSQQPSTKKTVKSSITRSSKAEARLKEWEAQSTVKLTPLNTAASSGGAEAVGDIGPPESVIGPGGEDEEDDAKTVSRRPLPSATARVETDEMGFSRAHIQKSDEDPLWFEKALLARGETISEAAYKAFKQAQSIQMKKEAEDLLNQNVVAAVKKTRGKPIFSNLTDPEYTADWISDAGVTSSLVSEVDMPISDYIKDEDVIDSSKIGEVEIDSVVLDDEVNTESMIRTATELEQSGVLDEITENLHSLLDISDHPESQNFTGMSTEEKNFAKEYDEAMEDADEPLQSIFLDEVHDSNKESKRGSQSFTGQDETPGKSSGTKVPTGEGEEEVDDYDDDTFIQMDTTISSETKQKSLSHRRSSKTLQNSSSSTVSASKDKKSSSSLNTSTTATGSGHKSIKVKASTSSAGTGGSGSGSGGSGSTLVSKSKKSASASKPKSYASTSSSTSKRLNSMPIPPDPPTSRHQKNILNLLEKEVYQKEVKRIRADRAREERNQEKSQKVAKEALERNKKTTWKDPDYTEILLPELFKYKSMSGLQAAKAKRSVLTPGINYGAPYFQMNGALSGTEGTEAMLAAARVESLDIPDLVREVLASNERMYRMTVEASEQMAKKAYKDKVKKEINKSVNKKR